MHALENANGAQATRGFLTGMIQHHQGAVAMAQTELAQGANPAAKQLAQAIMTTQITEIAEIAEMKKPLGGWRASVADMVGNRS